jgi:hypothetical protein
MDWKLVKAATGEPEVVTFDREEDLTLGFSLLRALAESDTTMAETSPGSGIWRVTKGEAVWER